jgi:hypothetical protein
MMFETTMDCEWGAYPCSDLFGDKVLQKFCSYKSDFDLGIVQRFFHRKKKGPNFLDFERKKEKFPDMYNRF